MTANKNHYQALEKMYLSGAINKIYQPKISVEKGRAEIEINVKEKLFHSGSAVHGSVCFKMLDDAAFFAANSVQPTFFMLTASFTLYFLRPVTSGILRSVGTLVSAGSSQFISESVVYNALGKEVARGSGVFVKSKKKLADVAGYSNA